MREVDPRPAPLRRFAEIVTAERFQRLEAEAHRARDMLASRTVWNVSSTAQGGGVAEMLQTLVAYGLGAGVDTRWLVLEGDPAFFAITKRIHNLLHGTPGDGGDLGSRERAHFVAVQESNLASAVERVRPGDVVLVHDPQPAGMIAGMRRRGARVVWRCHVGADVVDEHTERGWAFLREFLEDAERYVFSRRQYAPSWLPDDALAVIPPSIDPFSAKNASLPPEDVRAVLRRAGLVGGPPGSGVDRRSLAFTRRDGSRGEVRAHAGLVDDGPLPEDARLVLQVSRWDRLKDMGGVLRAFAEHPTEWDDDVHLVLAGPEVTGVSDDPEGADVLAECRALRDRLSAEARRRIHLVCLPMDDADENAHLVNALQRRADLVVQKSLVEGFGLTVTEPMWKGRPVVASAVGGIRDQVHDGVDGLLLDDPHDLATFARLAGRVLREPDLAARLGGAARERVRDQYLGDRHLIQYGELFADLLGPSTP
ncbi:glycosyltransferase [Nocardioides sp. GXQ0305]|uniref:glycosyltransferase n=1 Tax=Nocardioides sp. GXQ0305 TaxID=3423912 RepID=UPI003D7E1693